MSAQRTLSRPAYLDGRRHLQANKPTNNGSKLTADQSRREAWCRECGTRVTVTRAGIEAGHCNDCAHDCGRLGGER